MRDDMTEISRRDFVALTAAGTVATPFLFDRAFAQVDKLKDPAQFTAKAPATYQVRVDSSQGPPPRFHRDRWRDGVLRGEEMTF